MSEEPLYQQIIRIKGQIKREIQVGGTLTELPCPFCGLPRCERTDYLRCGRCGKNWLHGEDYNRDPSIARYRTMVAGQSKPKPRD